MAFGDADASTPAPVKANVAGKTVTTASFTPPSGALLIAHAFHDTPGGNLTSSSAVTDSVGLTWTRFATVSKADDGTGFNDGHIALSWAVATGVAMTVTTTGTNTNNPAGLYVRVVTGADTTTPIDVVIEGTSDNAAISQAITTVTDGARGFIAATDWNLAANPTAGAGQTAVWSDGIGAPDMRVYVGVQNAVTSPAGSVTMSTATPTTGNHNNWAAYALRPAAGGTPTNLNAGNAAATVAANAAALSSSPAAGSAAAAIAANAAALRSTAAGGNAAITVAANGATLASLTAAGNAAATVAAFGATVTSGTTLSAGPAPAGIAAATAGLTASQSGGSAAAGLSAAAASVTAGLSATIAAVAVAAFDATLTGGATALTPTGAIIGVRAFDATLTGSGVEVSTPVAGSWQGLLDILREIRSNAEEQRAMAPVACPRCGEPLYTAHAQLRCRFCGIPIAATPL